MVRTALVDEDASVRAAAAQAFDSLQEHLGGKAVDQTIPTLLEALRQPGESSSTALQALKEVMSVGSLTDINDANYAHTNDSLGSRELGIPRAHSNFVVLTYDRVQCSSIRILGDCCWECPEQAT